MGVSPPGGSSNMSWDFDDPNERELFQMRFDPRLQEFPDVVTAIANRDINALNAAAKLHDSPYTQDIEAIIKRAIELIKTPAVNPPEWHPPDIRDKFKKILQDISEEIARTYPNTPETQEILKAIADKNIGKLTELEKTYEYSNPGLWLKIHESIEAIEVINS